MPTYQALKVTSGTEQMPGVGDGQSAKCMASTYNFTAAPVAADVVKSALIQAGSVITDVVVISSTGGTMQAGIAATPAYFISALTAQGVARLNVANAPYLVAANGTVDVTLAGGGGVGFVTVIVYFLPRNA